MNALPRKKPLATYGKPSSSRKRKSNELFADMMDEFSPRRIPRVTESTSPEKEHLESPISGSLKARRMNEVKSRMEGFGNTQSTEIDHDKTPTKSSITAQKVPTRDATIQTMGNRRRQNISRVKSPDVFDLPSSDDDTAKKPIKKVLVKKNNLFKTRVDENNGKSKPEVSKASSKSQSTKALNTKSEKKGTVHSGQDGSSIMAAKTYASTSRKAQAKDIGEGTIQQKSATPPTDKDQSKRRRARLETTQDDVKVKEPVAVASESDFSDLPENRTNSPRKTNRVSSTITKTVETSIIRASQRRTSPHIVNRSAQNIRPKTPSEEQTNTGQQPNKLLSSVQKPTNSLDVIMADDDLVNESMLLGEPSNIEIITIAPTPRASRGRFRNRDISDSKDLVTHSLTNLLEDIGSSKPIKKRRLIDSLKVGANYVPRSFSSHDEENEEEDEVEDGLNLIQSGKDNDQDEKIHNSQQESRKDNENKESQGSQGDSQHSQGHSQPREYLSLGRGPIRNTYARSRSYLTEEIVGEESFDTPLLLGSTIQKSKPFFDEGLEDDEPKKGGVRSIHELREAGGSKRFLDDIEGYMEDVEAVERSRKRLGYELLSSIVLFNF